MWSIQSSLSLYMLVFYLVLELQSTFLKSAILKAPSIYLGNIEYLLCSSHCESLIEYLASLH